MQQTLPLPQFTLLYAVLSQTDDREAVWPAISLDPVWLNSANYQAYRDTPTPHVRCGLRSRLVPDKLATAIGATS